MLLTDGVKFFLVFNPNLRSQFQPPPSLTTEQDHQLGNSIVEWCVKVWAIRTFLFRSGIIKHVVMKLWFAIKSTITALFGKVHRRVNQLAIQSWWQFLNHFANVMIWKFQKFARLSLDLPILKHGQNAISIQFWRGNHRKFDLVQIRLNSQHGLTDLFFFAHHKPLSFFRVFSI